MKKTIVFLFFILTGTMIFAASLTEQSLPDSDSNAFWSGERAKPFIPLENNFSEIEKITLSRNWTLMIQLK